jgi:hypothetical protein
MLPKVELLDQYVTSLAVPVPGPPAPQPVQEVTVKAPAALTVAFVPFKSNNDPLAEAPIVAVPLVVPLKVIIPGKVPPEPQLLAIF